MTKVLPGRKGYLFLDNDTNNVQLQISGVPFMTEERFTSIASAHRHAVERAKARDGRYIHIIAPNKETACRDYLPLPEMYEMHGKTPANLFCANSEWSSATYFNHNVLNDHTCQYGHYDAEESHWSSTGALAYFDHAFSAFGMTKERNSLRKIPISVSVKSSHADLALLSGLPARMLPRAEVSNPRAVPHFRGDVANEGYVQHYSSECGVGRVLILHDSFLEAALPFLTEVFAETLAVHCPDFLLDLEDAYKPDLVIKLQAERFLPYVPVERVSMDEWLSDVEKRKQADCRQSRSYIGSIIRPQSRIAAE